MCDRIVRFIHLEFDETKNILLHKDFCLKYCQQTFEILRELIFYFEEN